MSENLQTLLNFTVSAAHAGGHVLLRYWHDGVELRDKSSDGGKSYDLVSDADLESQSVIAGLIEGNYPDHEMLGEEDLQGDLDAEYLWVIDPLDGTNNFAHRIEHFAVSIGLFVRGVPAVGVVHNPLNGDTYTAIRGGGAFRNSHPMKTSSANELSKAMIGCGFYYDRGDMMRSTLSAIEDFFSHHIHGIRRFGTASLDLCAVAAGQLGAFFEYKLSPWDFAAGQLIVSEAGGIVTDARGAALGLSPSSVLAASKNLFDAALEITAKHHPESESRSS